jgi:hypothetical protein
MTKTRRKTMDKITKSLVYTGFVHLANALNKPVFIDERTLKQLIKANHYFAKPARVALNYHEVGSWSLSYNSTYGGWIIEEMQNERGGISHPMTSDRRSASEFINSISFAMSALYQKERSL